MTTPITEEYNRDGIEVGDYVDYVPDTVSTPYPRTRLTNQYTGADDTEGRENSDIPQENLKWKVLRKYEDGSLDIVSEDTTSRLILDRIQGYNNGVFLLNDIAKKLYSKPSKGIFARSINLEDIEYHLKQTTKGKQLLEYGFETGGWALDYPEWTYTAGRSIPKIYYLEKEQGKSRSDDIITELQTTNLNYVVPAGKTITIPKERYYTLPLEFRFGFLKDQGTVNALKTINDSYWVASRMPRSQIIYFDAGSLGDRAFTGYNYDLTMKFVVRLRPTTKLQKSTDASNTGGTPHKILEY